MGLYWVLIFVDRSRILHEFTNDHGGFKLGDVNGISAAELAGLARKSCESIC
jgi:hypothetical protein